MTFIDDDKVDQANSFKSIMMKECFPQRQRGSLPEKKWLCVRRVTHYSRIGACCNCTRGSYEGLLQKHVVLEMHSRAFHQEMER